MTEQRANASGVTEYARKLADEARAELAAIVSGKKPYLTPDQWKPVAYAATAPENGVTLDGGPLREAFDRNVSYLNAWFARTEGGRALADPKNWWESVLQASSEGRMLGAAAHTLRWGERADMRRIVTGLVEVVKTRQRVDGYCLPYDEADMAGHENPGRDERRNYDRVNLTRGMVAAARVGNPDALAIMRRFYDWLYASPYNAGLLAGPFDGTASKENVCVGQGGGGTAHNCNNGHEGSLLMYFSPVGKPEDLVAAERTFVQDFFIEASRRREALSLSHYPLHIAHCYVLLAYLAWLDHYRATGAVKYLEAAKGAWDIVHDHFLHVGGSLAICENVCGAYEPGSRYLRVDREHHTGENCGSVFWADINHRLLQLFPEEERYAAQIEQEIFNCVLANQDGRGHVRYHARLENRKERAHSVNTCCEVFGSPFVARLPQYLYSVAPDGLYVNLFAPSAIAWKRGEQSLTLKTLTNFPGDGKVRIEVSGAGGEGVAMRLHLRVPGWAGRAVPVRVNGAEVAVGAPGRYATLDRVWRDGDTVELDLPLQARVVRYEGADQIPNRERYALLCGPILMALVGATDLDIPATELPGRLRAVAGAPLHFTVQGVDGVLYRPYWLVEQESFTCFPTMR
jgi:hypothetical protein